MAFIKYSWLLRFSKEHHLCIPLEACFYMVLQPLLLIIIHVTLHNHELIQRKTAIMRLQLKKEEEFSTSPEFERQSLGTESQCATNELRWPILGSTLTVQTAASTRPLQAQVANTFQMKTLEEVRRVNTYFKPCNLQ